MKNNLLFSVPFDEKNLILTNHVCSILKVENLHYISKFKEKSKTYISGVSYNYIPKFTSANRYKNHKSVQLPDFFNFIDDYQIRLLDQITYRWFRTFKVSDNYNEITFLSEQIIRYWYDYIINNKISYLFLGNYPHTPHDYAIYLVCDYLRIKTFFLLPMITSREKNRYIVSTSIDGENLTTNNMDDANINIDLYGKFYQTKDELSSNQNIFEGYQYNLILNKLKSLFKTKPLELRYYFRNVLFFVIGLFREIRLKKHIKRIEKIELHSDKYIFFPLHLQPEATTLPTGGRFVDQLKIIETVAYYLPDEYSLVVKEHPGYWYNRWRGGVFETMDYSRSESFYNKIQSISNVVMIQHDFSSIELLEKATAVISVSGTIILEANVMGVTSIMFGNHFYKFMPHSIYIDSIDKLKDSFKLLGEKKQEPSDTIDNYLKNIEVNSVVFFMDNEGQMVEENNQIELNRLLVILKKFFEYERQTLS